MSANHKEMSFTKNLTFKEVFDELITAKDATIGTNEEVKQTALYQGKAEMCAFCIAPFY